MIYAPHILEKQILADYEYDENGNPIVDSESSTWERIGKCKCYKESADRTFSVNGVSYPAKYRVVAERIDINAGDVVRVLDKSGSIRGEGIVVSPKVNDYLNYCQIWLV